MTRRLALGSAAVPLFVLAGCGGHLARQDGTLFPEPAANAITFWGHACCYIDLEGFGIVTDPVFEQRAPFRWRKIGAPPPPAYRNARIVLLSHAHGDHLSPRTLATFPPETVILCPEPCVDHLREIGRRVEAMRPGDTFEIPGGKITAVVAVHPGGRRGFRRSEDGDALGWVIEAPAATIFWSGDTNLFPGFDDVGARFRPDVALLNISGHLHGMDAVRAAWASRALTIVPLHYGAYGWFFFSEPEKPRDWEIMQTHLGSQLVILDLGESLALSASRRSGP